jgi:predicted nucleic acid-binding protein
VQTGSAVFLDTSIFIARMFHTPQKRRKILRRIEDYDISITSLIVKNEFKRRVLKEAQYLLNLLNKHESLDVVMNHVLNVLPPQSSRKQKIALNICLAMLPSIHSQSDDAERAERAKRYLRTLLRCGLSDFDASVDHVIRESGCACAKHPVIEKKPYKSYEFGPSKCSSSGHLCEVVSFLAKNREMVVKIRDRLYTVPEGKRSGEISMSIAFLDRIITDPSVAQELEPCSNVGDLLIALESLGIPTFYTLNAKESQHFCRALGQTLVVRPNNPDVDDVVCSASETSWPEF